MSSPKEFIDNIDNQLATAKMNLEYAAENWEKMDKPPVDLEEALNEYNCFLTPLFPPEGDDDRVKLENEIVRLERLVKMIRHWLNFEPPIVEEPHRRRLRHSE
jgi:hypothetical protein